jgi:hypothetical protein
MVTDPSLPMRASLEYACSWLAQEVVDSGTKSVYTSGNPNTAIASMVQGLMGLPKSEAQPAVDILLNHYNSALKANQSATTALRSTFILGCTSPQVTSIGAF